MLKQKCVIIKPDKSHEIVLLSNEAYSSSLNRIFDDELKFKKVSDDSKLSRLDVLPNYIWTLNNHKEITENLPESCLCMKSDLPKLNRPIIDEVCTFRIY